MGRVLILAALVTASVLAVLLLLTDTTVGMLAAIGWLAVVFALYLGSLLVP